MTIHHVLSTGETLNVYWKPTLLHMNNNKTLMNETECPNWYQVIGSNATFSDDCPDALSVPILSGLSYGVYFILVSVSIVGLVWKRKSDHIRARTTAGMVFTLVSSFSVVTVFTLRYIMGREAFPCLFFSLVFFLMPPSFSVPTILRSLRVYFQWRFNLFKATKFKENEVIILEDNASTPTNISSLSSSPSSPTNLIPVSSGQRFHSSNSHSKRKGKFLKYCNHILQSHKWLTLTFFIVYGIQIVVWFLLGTIEESYFPDSRFLMEDEPMISLQGCYSLPSISYIGLVSYGFYLIIQAICLILLLKTDKDTYFIKVETFIVMIIQVASVALYAALGQKFYRIVDRIFPAGLVMVFYLSLEIIVTVTLPVVYALLKERQTIEVFENELEWALNNVETCEMLLEYSRRSFCPEGVLVYKDISKFKLASTFKKRKQLAMLVVENYLTFGGVYELNLPNVNNLKEDILFRINSAMVEEELPDDLFHTVQVQTLITLKDVFERLRRSNEKMRKLLAEWRERTPMQTMNISQSPPTLNPSYFV